MYGKLFVSIYDGTLAEDWRALVTFQQMIILCDQDGILDMTPLAIQKRTGIPIEHIKAGIEILESEDPYSRTPREHGKRIIRLSDDRPWGWHIVNHKHYRDLRTAEERREYMREYMRGKRAKDKLTKTNKSLHKLHVSKLANTDTDTDTKDQNTMSGKPDDKRNNYLKQATEIIAFLNEKTGKAYQCKSPAGKQTQNAKIIIQRIKEGYTVQDMKTVIARKCREWQNTDMSKYLRPATLFNATKFEQYKGECV